MIHPLRRTIVNWILLLFIAPLLSLTQVQGASSATYSATYKARAQENQASKSTEGTLEGGGAQSSAYQITLGAGQYAKLVVEQKGIDVAARLFGPDGKLIAVFDSEFRRQGQEIVSWVAENAGSYRLDLLSKYKNAAAGGYEVRLVELRAATENERLLQQAYKLRNEYFKLIIAGNIGGAQPVAEHILQIRERVLGPEHPDVAQSLANLAYLYYSKGEYSKAEPLFKRAVDIGKKSLGPDNPILSFYLESLANVYNEMQKYSEADPLYNQVLAIREAALEPDHPLISYADNNLADSYRKRGDYYKAEPYYRKALAIAEKSLGQNDPDVANILSNLGFLLFTMAEDDMPEYYDKAEPLYLRALDIYEKVLGGEDPGIIPPLSNLAFLYAARGEDNKAEPLFQRALSIAERKLGPEHPGLVPLLNGSAGIYLRREEYAKAEPLYQRALAIGEKVLPAEHTDIIESLYNLGELYTAKGDTGLAITFLSRANMLAERNFAYNLDIGSERQKLAYLKLLTRLTDFTLTLQSKYAQKDERALELAFTTMLLRKARALDSMTDTISSLRRNATPRDQGLFDKLKEDRSQLSSLKLKESGRAAENYQGRVKQLEDEVDNLESDLSARSAAFRAQTQQVTINSVQSALPSDSALVEFALYRPIGPSTEKREMPRYLVYVLASQGQPKWVDLGEAARIDQAVEAWRDALRDPNRTDVKLLARSVDEKVMRPVRALLGGTSHLLIAPDGKLNLIPFNALVDEGNQYQIERYSMSYLTSGRDLLRLQLRQPSRQGPVVLANPDFGRFATIAMRTDRGAGKARARLDLDQIFFQPLPGTEDEALAVKALLPNATVLRREQATETALKHVKGPSILHIATHGFFLENNDPAPMEKDPLRLGSPGTAALASAQANPYTVQLGSTTEFNAAEEKVKGLRTRGLNAYLVKSEVKGKGEFYRVRAGSFRTQDEAQKYGAELRGKGVVSEFFVARYEPPQRGLMEQAAKEPSANLRLSKFATKVEDPALRSGLALAGANQGKSGDDDGILTAAEAAYLDLLGTKLVVLSACDTGVGEVKNGEGVQGLRRALVLAGSESQVMTLWPVSDEATKDLMIPYYKALQRGEGRGEGLRQVQLRMLHGRKDERHPFYWAAFIQSGEWANMDGRR